MTTELKNQNILFFDGLCHLCNGYVDFLLKFKPKGIYFAPLQGSTAQKILESSDYLTMSSLVYYKNEKIYRKSSAALESLIDTHPLFIFMRVLFIIPKFIRDLIYDFIAQRRYKIFGKAETCRLPTPEERTFFKD